MRPQLTEGEIAAKDSHPRGAERIRQRDEKWSVAVRSRAVRQHEAITASMSGEVKVPSNGYFIRRSVKKLSTVHMHRLCSQAGCIDIFEIAQVGAAAFGQAR